MSNIEQYYNQKILTQSQGFDKSVCVPFEQLTNEQKKAFEDTMNYKLFILSQAWGNLKSVSLKAIRL